MKEEKSKKENNSSDFIGGSNIIKYRGKDIDVVIPATVKSIGDFCFADCDITSVVIPDSVTSIGKYAFCNCAKLKSLHIPRSVDWLGEFFCEGCDSLESLTISADNPVYVLKDDCIIKRATGELILAVKNGSKVIVVPKDVTAIHGRVFAKCDADDLSVADDNLKYRSELNCIIEKATNVLTAGCKKSVVPDGVTAIGDNAFGCCEFTQFALPSSVTSIGKSAFSYCSDLTKITLPVGLIEIGENAFIGCSGLTKITLPVGLRKIGKNAFADCTRLESVTLPDTVVSVGNDVFFNCDKLKEVYIPKSVTSVGDDVFSDCNNLTIYCEYESQPDGWSDKWNKDGRPVVWGYKF